MASIQLRMRAFTALLSLPGRSTRTSSRAATLAGGFPTNVTRLVQKRIGNSRLMLSKRAYSRNLLQSGTTLLLFLLHVDGCQIEIGVIRGRWVANNNRFAAIEREHRFRSALAITVRHLLLFANCSIEISYLRKGIRC